MPTFKRGCVVLLLISAAACDRNASPTAPAPASPNPAPTPSPTPGPCVALFPEKLTLTGNGSLTAVGQTSQMTATLVFSDGTSEDVTNDPNAQWTSDAPSIAIVSSGGLLTAIGLGRSQVWFVYRCGSSWGRGTSLVVTVTPAGTFVVWGKVREPGHGPLPNVLVADALSQRTTMTNAEGSFSLAGLTSGHLRFSREAYETLENDVVPDVGARDVLSFVPMQRIVHVTAGLAISPEPLHVYDVAYTMPGGHQCRPCRLIHVDVPGSGTLRFQLTWITGGPELELWVGGQRFLRSNAKAAEVDTEMPVSAGEIVVYVGSAAAPPSCSGGGESCWRASFTLAISSASMMN